ncbi:MAG TPA: 16S rRNA (adenine(1518)-N(6)/adenine(1519)-N(6))-dimethyltransferase RsmA [Bacteroidetes bacterium]|nr:16S rRNA (adenine(1518)-N(6)/adenine(1519)-N(6))-dimethyltransferase RsmA [Bacteroidota bacterium]
MQLVRPKKQLGQHFLTDKSIAQRIVDSLDATNADAILEIGPGMGVLTEPLLAKFGEKLFAADVDGESVKYLSINIPQLKDRLLHADFLSYDLNQISTGKIAIIGNFPYNISSQIFFKVIENRESITEVVGMVQREVGQRICEPPGSKTYGILSVMLQAYFDIKYLFTVSEGVFTPPPKVKSAVIRLTRNNISQLGCNEQLFLKVIKAGFNQRRKTLRNSIQAVFGNITKPHPLFDKRPEQLGVSQFIELTNHIEKHSS